jgi:hypothetical protein
MGAGRGCAVCASRPAQLRTLCVARAARGTCARKRGRAGRRAPRRPGQGPAATHLGQLQRRHGCAGVEAVQDAPDLAQLLRVLDVGLSAGGGGGVRNWHGLRAAEHAAAGCDRAQAPSAAAAAPPPRARTAARTPHGARGRGPTSARAHRPRQRPLPPQAARRGPAIEQQYVLASDCAATAIGPRRLAECEILDPVPPATVPRPTLRAPRGSPRPNGPPPGCRWGQWRSRSWRRSSRSLSELNSAGSRGEL